MFPLQKTWVLSLVGELRSYKLLCVAKKLKKKKKILPIIKKFLKINKDEKKSIKMVQKSAGRKPGWLAQYSHPTNHTALLWSVKKRKKSVFYQPSEGLHEASLTPLASQKGLIPRDHKRVPWPMASSSALKEQTLLSPGERPHCGRQSQRNR